MKKETPLTPKQFHWCFTNSLSREDSDAVYERYYIPGAGRPFFQAGLANFNPNAVSKIDYKNPNRAPLLFITGAEDRISPPSVNRANSQEAEEGALRHRVQGIPGTLPLPGAGRLGGGRRLRAGLDRQRHAGRMTVRMTHIGGPTVLIEVGGWRLLTDPTFDPAGGKYNFGWGTGSRKLAGPAIPAADVAPIDAVLLSHDHHDDNLDLAGRALLPSAGVVVTTVSGAKRLGNDARGLEPWATTRLEAPERPPIEITATPCRHGPPLSHPFVGDVIGFALRWDGQEHGVLWISGDTVLYDGVRQVAARLEVDTALLHLGGVRFPVTGPIRYTLTAQEAVELCRLVRPRTVIPIHYEGWKHFRQGRDAIEREFASAPEDMRRRIRWLPIGVGVEVGA